MGHKWYCELGEGCLCTIDYMDHHERQRVKSRAIKICKYPALTFFLKKYDADKFILGLK